MLNMALNMARRQEYTPVYIASLEMSREEITERLIAALSAIKSPGHGLNSEDISERRIPPEKLHIFNTAVSALRQIPIYIDDTGGITPTQLREWLATMTTTYGRGVAFVDYVQLMGTERNYPNGNERVSYLSRSLKEIAKATNMPLVALSQLSRATEARQDKRPILSDLRDSGSLEQDADIVMFLYRDDYYNEDTERINQLDVEVAKRRSGTTGTATLFFARDTQLITGLKYQNIELNL
jgi:replicative DNA helicase